VKYSIAAVHASALLALAASAAPADVTLPRGTSIEVRIVTPFDSDRTARGKTFQAAVIRPLFVGGQLAIPGDAVVMGEIKHVRSPRDGAKSGAIAVKFETLDIAARSYDIEGVLTSFHADERKKILEQEAKLTTGRKVNVVLIGSGTEPNRKASTLVGTSGENREDLADEWAVSGLGPPFVGVTRGTVLAMRLDKALTVPVAAAAGAPAAGDRNILVSSDDVRRAQRALKARGLYAGDASGLLDEPTRRAIAGFQIDCGQPATGDLDDVTAKELAAAP
jgi:putative peptidoglycan binding protein